MNWSTGLVLATAASIVSGPLSQQAAPRFAAEVARVRVDVIVTDKQGKFVADLRGEDFALFEDGNRQKILNVQLVDLLAGEVRSLSEADRPERGVLATETIPARPASDFGAIIFFVDMPGLYFQNKLRFADALSAMLQKIDDVSVPHAVYFVDIVGRLRELVPLTQDIHALSDAASRLRAIPLSQTRDNIFAFLESDMGGLTRWSEAVQRTRAIHTYELLKGFVESLAARPGRTALVWVSTGVDLGAYQTVALQRGGDPRNPTFRFYSADQARIKLQEELHHAANTSNVSIYSVDPSALHEFYGITTSGRPGSAGDARGNSLRDAARETGGESFVAWTDLGRVLERIERDASRFYLLSYSPSHDSTEGEYHEIHVEVRAPELEVRARHGYVEYSAEDRRSRMIRGALELPGVVSGLDVAVEGIRARNDAGQALLVVAIAVDAGSRGLIAKPPTTSGPLLVYATAHNKDGELVAQARDVLGPAGEPLTSDRVSPAARPPGVTAPFVTHRVTWALDPGDYTVRVAIHDPLTDRLGAAGFDVQIPDVVDQWHTSDPAVLVDDQAGDMPPIVGGMLFPAQSAVVYVEVYNGKGPVLSATLSEVGAPGQKTPGARDLAPRTLGYLPLERDGTIHRGTLPLPGLEPGDYLLEVLVEDLPAGEQRVVSLPIRVFAVQ